MTIYADGIALMCEKCDKFPARFYVSGGFPPYDGICQFCAGDICELNGDMAGAEKFRALGY